MGFWCWAENGGDVQEISQMDVDHWRNRHPKEASVLGDEDIVADMYSTDNSIETGEEIFIVNHDLVARFEVSAKAVRVEAATSRLN